MNFLNLSCLTPVLRAVAVGVPAGYIFHLLHTPIPWMIGPMIAVAALNLMGAPMASPPYARQMGQVILGSAVGLYFTPSVVRELAANFPAILAATVAVFIVGGFGALTLSRASGVDGKSTFFASIPGGAMAMAVLADKYGAEIAPVAVAHSLRVSLVVILIPFALTYGGIPLVASAYRPDVPLDYAILVPWLLIGCVLGEVSERLHMHNGYLLAPIFFGAALTMSGVQLSAVPHGFTDFAQLMFGLVLGARYERAFFVRYKLFIPFALLNSMFILVASVIRSAARLVFQSADRNDAAGYISRRSRGNDDYRAGAEGRRASRGRLSLISGDRGEYGDAVYLHVQRVGARRARRAPRNRKNKKVPRDA